MATFKRSEKEKKGYNKDFAVNELNRWKNESRNIYTFRLQDDK